MMQPGPATPTACTESRQRLGRTVPARRSERFLQEVPAEAITVETRAQPH